MTDYLQEDFTEFKPMFSIYDDEITKAYKKNDSNKNKKMHSTPALICMDGKDRKSLTGQSAENDNYR